MPAERTIEVWSDTQGPETVCSGPTCTAKIVWATIVKSGKKMCFDARAAVPLYSKTDEQTGRLILAMPFDANHWHRCPDSQRFRSR